MSWQSTRRSVALLSAITAILLVACELWPDVQDRPYEPNPTPTPSPSPAYLRVTTSSTLWPAASALLDAFSWPHGELVKHIESRPADQVVETLEQGTSNVVMVAGQLTDVPLADLEITAIGQMPLAIVVNRSNPIQNLTSAQVRAIFAGEILDWSQVGSESGPILVITQPPGSEAWLAITSLLLRDPSANPKTNAPITRAALMAPDDQAVAELVAQEPGAIGYAALGALPLDVHPVALDGVRPTPAEVAAGRYPLIEPIYLITRKDPPAHVSALVDFALSPTGQKLLMSTLGQPGGGQ
jgi:phosphate transport system substrate-binding protein